MATNVEIKARVNDIGRLRERVEALSDAPCEVISQRDGFFNTAKGRLKLRVLAPDRAHLVYYERADVSGPRRSDYNISDMPDPESLEKVLSACLGVRGVVSKVRSLYKVGNTRIHLDQVEGLGCFLELEAVLGPDQTAEQGQEIVSDLMAKLGIAKADLIDIAYIDLLEGGSD